MLKILSYCYWFRFVQILLDYVSTSIKSYVGVTGQGLVDVSLHQWARRKTIKSSLSVQRRTFSFRWVQNFFHVRGENVGLPVAVETVSCLTREFRYVRTIN